jgi:methionyl aminopeptidase
MFDLDTIKKLREAGKIAGQVRREGAKKLAVSGASHLEVMDFCEKRIKELGGEIAWAQMAVNKVAAHYCPTAEETAVTKEGDVIKIDVGVHKEGWIADNAMTVEVGRTDAKLNNKNGDYADLIKAAKNALKAALKIAKPGTKLWELGEAQLSETEALGFTTIKNLSGHTLGQYRVHGGVSIPTYNTKEKTELEEGWQVAIEPFATDGDGLIKAKGDSTIFMQSRDAGVRSPYAKKILQDIKQHNGMPFTTRWLTRKFGKGATALGMRELLRSNIVRDYPPLVEVAGGMVSQFEHSLIVKDKPEVYTRHEDDSW